MPEAEQVFKVCGVRTIPENEDEVEITVLLRKNNLSVNGPQETVRQDY